MNGIINIITREASDSQGGLLSLAAGNELKGLVEVRQGFEILRIRRHEFMSKDDAWMNLKIFPGGRRIMVVIIFRLAYAWICNLVKING